MTIPDVEPTESGTVAGASAIARDSTERHERDEALRRALACQRPARAPLGELGLPGLGPAQDPALLVPLSFRGSALGLLAVAVAEGGADDGTEAALQAIAAQAATAVASGQSVEQSRLRQSIEAGERERARWARELHDETLQGLADLRVLLACALRAGDVGSLQAAAADGLEHCRAQIAAVRSLICELRPAALDELSLSAALEELVDRHRARGLAVRARIELRCAQDGAQRLDPELESAVYRICQEALANVTRHARASRVEVEVVESAGALHLRVADDGAGMNGEERHGGFGLLGLRERVALAGGDLRLDSAPGAGTTIAARLPAVRERLATRA